MKKCPICHKDVPEDSLFCPYCGASLKESSVNETKKDEGKPSLDDYLPHDLSGNAINNNANTEGPQPTYKKEEKPQEKQWESGQPYYDNEIRQTGEEVRAAEGFYNGHIIAIVALVCSFFGTLGIPFGIWGLFKAKRVSDRIMDIVAILLSASWIVLLIIEWPQYMAYIEQILGGSTNA